MYGAGSDEAKPQVAGSWWIKAAEAGHPSALGHYGQLLCDGQGVARRNEAAGVPMLVRAAEAGDPEAMVGLALLYQQGTKQIGVLERDIPKSELWLRRAADTGTATAHYNLAILLRDFASELGTVLEAHDHAVQVAKQLRLAADQGHVSAMANLGARTFQGIGVQKDEAEALRLWRAAAARGNANAKRSLQTVAAMMR
jgi:TPR repeat protein